MLTDICNDRRDAELAEQGRQIQVDQMGYHGAMQPAAEDLFLQLEIRLGHPAARTSSWP